MLNEIELGQRFTVTTAPSGRTAFPRSHNDYLKPSAKHLDEYQCHAQAKRQHTEQSFWGCFLTHSSMGSQEVVFTQPTQLFTCLSTMVWPHHTYTLSWRCAVKYEYIILCYWGAFAKCLLCSVIDHSSWCWSFSQATWSSCWLCSIHWSWNIMKVQRHNHYDSDCATLPQFLMKWQTLWPFQSEWFSSQSYDSGFWDQFLSPSLQLSLRPVLILRLICKDLITFSSTSVTFVKSFRN